MTTWILIVIIAVLLAILVQRKSRPGLRARLRRGKDKIIGICAVALGQDAKKKERKEEILMLLSQKARSSSSGQGELSNSDIREALGISATSVVRYMDELEKEGKVEQIGTTGHAVTYRLR